MTYEGGGGGEEERERERERKEEESLLLRYTGNCQITSVYSIIVDIKNECWRISSIYWNFILELKDAWNIKLRNILF